MMTRMTAAPPRRAPNETGVWSLGTTLLYAALVALLNLVVDVAYVFIDPRVRLE